MDNTINSDVTVVGGGAAGVGVGVALSHLDLDVQILERDDIGASFRSWPAEMRFLTPSFPANALGIPDLNAIVPNTSPGFVLDCQQPSGEQYAEYLCSVADHYELQIETTAGTRTSDFLIWAGGQFGTPWTELFPGSELAVHNSTVDSWEAHTTEHSDEFLIVGGFESGIELTDEDESTETPGLFLSGPDVQHDGQLFCFIYKFRVRFPVIAQAIGERLDVETDGHEAYEDANMFLEDLSCCEPVDCDC